MKKEPVGQNKDLGKQYVGQIQVRILKLVGQDSGTGPGEVGKIKPRINYGFTSRGCI